MIFGYLLYSTNFINHLRDIRVIAWTTLIFGIILYIADKNNFNKSIRTNLNIKTALFIGFFLASIFATFKLSKNKLLNLIGSFYTTVFRTYASSSARHF